MSCATTKQWRVLRNGKRTTDLIDQKYAILLMLDGGGSIIHEKGGETTIYELEEVE